MIMHINKKLALLILLATPLAACKRPEPAEPPPRPALTMQVGASSSSQEGWLVGEVRPRFESAQGFRIGGKITARKVEVGDIVKKGQVLAVLDTTDTGLALASAEAQIRAAEADSALAKADFERQSQLLKRNFISQAALDSFDAKAKATAARVAQLRADADVAKHQSQYTSLIAERDGVITEIHAEPGQVVTSGETVAKVAVPDMLEVLIAVPESRIKNLASGSATAVRLWADRSKLYVGKIREISPSADSLTRTFNVRVSVTNPDAGIHMGMTAGVKLPSTDNKTGEEAKSYTIPNSAVTEQNGTTLAWVVDEKTYQVQPRNITVGPYTESGVTVSSGLSEGETIVVAGVHALVAGQVVTPVAAHINQ
jgi:RND family efflux transporter MFP subunit